MHLTYFFGREATGPGWWVFFLIFFFAIFGVFDSQGGKKFQTIGVFLLFQRLSSWIFGNRGVGDVLCGCFCGLPFYIIRKSHIAQLFVDLFCPIFCVYISPSIFVYIGCQILCGSSLPNLLLVDFAHVLFFYFL